MTEEARETTSLVKTVKRVLWLVALLSFNAGVGIGLLIARWTQ